MLVYSLIHRHNVSNSPDTVIMIFEDKDLADKLCERLNTTTGETYIVEPHTFIPKNTQLSTGGGGCSNSWPKLLDQSNVMYGGTWPPRK